MWTVTGFAAADAWFITAFDSTGDISCWARRMLSRLSECCRHPVLQLQTCSVDRGLESVASNSSGVDDVDSRTSMTRAIASCQLISTRWLLLSSKLVTSEVAEVYCTASSHNQIVLHVAYWLKTECADWGGSMSAYRTADDPSSVRDDHIIRCTHRSTITFEFSPKKLQIRPLVRTRYSTRRTADGFHSLPRKHATLVHQQQIGFFSERRYQ